jgi:hypothetical protein
MGQRTLCLWHHGQEARVVSRRGKEAIATVPVLLRGQAYAISQQRSKIEV